MLTITGLDRLLRRRPLQLFPDAAWQPLKIAFEMAADRLPGRPQPTGHPGIRDAFWRPIFVIFVLTHVLLIGYGILSHVGQIGAGHAAASRGFQDRPGHPGRVGACSSSSSGRFPWAAARSPGSRPSPTAFRSCASPGSRTGKKTMVYHGHVAGRHRRRHPASAICCSTSCPMAGRTLNAVLAGKALRRWSFGARPGPDHHFFRRRAPARRRPDRLRRRTAGHGQHGRRITGSRTASPPCPTASPSRTASS